MKKYLLSLFLCVLNATISVAAPSVSSDFMTGITLDCARKYNSPSFIKTFIDSLSLKKNSFLILHLTDNENVGVECILLDQTVELARELSDGSYLNERTGHRFLSYQQIEELIMYAQEKGVLLIPEIEMPAHFNGFFTLASAKYGANFVRSIAVDQEEVPGELNMNSTEGLQMAFELLEEYADVFSQANYFSIGADEYWTNYGEKTVRFINRADSILSSKGFITMIYNDLIWKENLPLYNDDLWVIYWSYDGMTDDEQTREERIAKKASLPELQDAGFNIILTNSYYLYFVPSVRNTNQHDLDYTVNDILNNWDLSKWDDEHSGGLDSYDHIVGSEVVLWMEEADGISSEVITQQVVRMYEAMYDVIEKSKSQENTDCILLPSERKKTLFVDEEGRLYIDQYDLQGRQKR